MRRYVSATTALVLGLALGIGAAHAQAPAQSAGALAEQRVVAVRVVTQAGEVLEENPTWLPLQPNQPYDTAGVRETLRQLYRRGHYADIRAEATSVEGGLRLDFVVRRNFFVNVVRVVGLREPPSEPWALAAMRLGLGEVFRESALADAVDRLRQTLRDEGFYQAQVTQGLAPIAATHQMDITVRVTPGPRARMGTIEVRGAGEYPSKTLLSQAKLKPGREVTSANLERAVKRVREFLVDKRHLSARVAVRRGEYDAASNTLPLTLDITAAPKVRVEVKGVKIAAATLRKLLPIYQEGSVDQDLLQEGRRAIRDHVESAGYFDSPVRVATDTDEKTGEQVITYTVERGARQRLVGIEFKGNNYFSDELLRSRLHIQPAAFLSRGRFSQRLLQDDQQSIQSIYVANGFREARVRSQLMQAYGGKEGHIFVRFHIEEGPQTLIAELKLEGNQALSEDLLMAEAIDSAPGQPYSEFNVAGDRDNILALYYNEGFPEARFAHEVDEDNPANRVRLTYRIVEGHRVTAKQVLISGHQTTRRGTIAREVQIEPGTPLRQRSLIETQQRLYHLGIFSRVQIAPQNPEGTDANKTVVVLVEEAKRYTLAYGIGFEVQRLGGGAEPVSGQVRASPRGVFEITRANFRGRAHTLSFKARASTLQGRALLSYTAPNFLARPDLSLLLTGFADKTRDVRTFTSKRYEASVQLNQRVSNLTSLLYRYAFRRVLVDAESLRVAPEQIPLFSQPTKISALGVSWICERRDNPADATRGDFNTLDLSLAAKLLGSSASFARFFAQNATFHSIRRRFIFARSTRIGIQEPLGDTTPFDIPLPERFFAGGGNTLRGFGMNQAGPRDSKTGFPLGGLAMLVFNQELRFPMRLPKLDSRVGGTIFYDAGNVFSRANRISLRGSPRSPDDLNYFSHTIGFGVRYMTPIGPVRFDIGYQLNRAEFLVPDGAGGQVLAKLPRFQFFFNIGSIF